MRTKRETDPRKMLPLDFAKAYLKKGPPYYGNSSWKDSKLLGHKDGGAGGAFDGKKKKFYAKTNEVLVKLLDTGRWIPDEPVCVPIVLKLIRAAEKAKLSAPAPSTSTERAVPTDEQTENHLKRTLYIPDDADETVKRLKTDYDINEDDIRETRRVKLFGPRSGISDAARVDRALKLGVITSKYFAKPGDVTD
jgi:hypothetical protein